MVTAAVSTLYQYSRTNKCARPSVVLTALCLIIGQALGQAEIMRFGATPSAPAGTRFETIAPSQSGITFTNRLAGLEYYKNMVAHNGAGVAAGDVNGDDLADIFLCNIQGANRLYLNQGDFRFEPAVGPHSMPEIISTGATLVDVDGDGGEGDALEEVGPPKAGDEE